MCFAPHLAFSFERLFVLFLYFIFLTTQLDVAYLSLSSSTCMLTVGGGCTECRVVQRVEGDGGDGGGDARLHLRVLWLAQSTMAWTAAVLHGP